MKFIHVLRYILFYCKPLNIFSHANNTFNERKTQGEYSKISSYNIETFFFCFFFFFHVNVICSMYPDQPAHSLSSCENGLGQCTTSICKERSVKVDLWCMISIQNLCSKMARDRFRKSSGWSVVSVCINNL